MLHIRIDDDDVGAGFAELRAAMRDDSVFRAMGEKLQRSHRKRAQQEQAPDGSHWQPRSDASEKIRARGKPKPKHHTILKHQGTLTQTYRYQVNHGQLLFGSSRPYAAIHQAGGEFKMFGKHTVIMPKREHIGLSRDDKKMVINLFMSRLRR